MFTMFTVHTGAFAREKHCRRDYAFVSEYCEDWKSERIRMRKEREFFFSRSFIRSNVHKPFVNSHVNERNATFRERKGSGRSVKASVKAIGDLAGSPCLNFRSDQLL